MRILITSIGKRVELVKHLKRKFLVVGADAQEGTAAKHFVDAFYRIPRCDDPEYLRTLLNICSEGKIDMVVPLYEDEFPILAAARKRFDKRSTLLILSDEKVLDICKDKFKTAEFFERYGIPAPKTYSHEELVEIFKTGKADFPLFIKPSQGMGSEGAHIVRNLDELDFYYRHVKMPIVQSVARGVEYTVDALCDTYGTPIYIVPRERIEVRSGEVVKSRTRQDVRIIDAAEHLLESLNEEGRVMGPMTIQCFVSEEGKISFIEINPRFGGGVPLAFAAGADYASALYEMREGKKWMPRKPTAHMKDFQEVSMYRYDSSVFEVHEDPSLDGR